MELISLGGILVGGVDEGNFELLGVVSRCLSHVRDILGHNDILSSSRGDATYNLLISG